MSTRTFRLAAAVGAGALLAAYGLITAWSASAAQVSCTPSAGFNTCVQFTYSGAQQTFTVPAGVTSLDAALLGADAGGAGLGGRATGTVAVTPGQTLTVTVGQLAGPFGGGGPGAGVPAGCSQLCGTDGGGMSALWNGAPNVAANALLIAGGGGGRGGGNGPGGDGGGLTGGTGAGGAGGGTQSAGGAGSNAICAPGTSGTHFQGGAGAGSTNGGGGGGGGWYGGGGGYCAPVNTAAGSGGGGSSYISGPGVTNGATTAGANAPNASGLVTLQFNVPVVDTPLIGWRIALLGGALVVAAGCTVAVRRRRGHAS
jgi:hypothetical protein